MPMELAFDLATLALYDIVIYADDSTSMQHSEGPPCIFAVAAAVLPRLTFLPSHPYYQFWNRS